MGVPPACHVPRPAILAKRGHPCTLCITTNQCRVKIVPSVRKEGKSVSLQLLHCVKDYFVDSMEGIQVGIPNHTLLAIKFG